MFSIEKQLFNTIFEASLPYFKFCVFLESLRRNGNDALIESIKKGTMVAFENGIKTAKTPIFEGGAVDYNTKDTRNTSEELLNVPMKRIKERKSAKQYDRRGVEGSLGDYLIDPKVLKQKMKDAHTIAKKSGGKYKTLYDVDPRLKLSAMAWVYYLSISFMVPEVSKWVREGTSTDPERDYLKASEDMAHKIIINNDALNQFDPFNESDAGFTTFLTNYLRSGRYKEGGTRMGVAMKSIGKKQDPMWSPKRPWLIQGPTDQKKLNEWRKPEVRYVPGSYVETNPGEFKVLKGAEFKALGAEKIYKRKLPEDQEKILKDIIGIFKNRKMSVSRIADEAKKWLNKKNLRIDFRIPTDLRAYPPDHPKVADYWFNIKQFDTEVGGTEKLDDITSDNEEEYVPFSRELQKGLGVKPEHKADPDKTKMVIDLSHKILNKFIESSNSMGKGTASRSGSYGDELKIVSNMVDNYYADVPSGTIDGHIFDNLFYTVILQMFFADDPEVSKRKLNELDYSTEATDSAPKTRGQIGLNALQDRFNDSEELQSKYGSAEEYIEKEGLKALISARPDEGEQAAAAYKKFGLEGASKETTATPSINDKKEYIAKSHSDIKNLKSRVGATFKTLNKMIGEDLEQRAKEARESKESDYSKLSKYDLLSGGDLDEAIKSLKKMLAS